MEVLYELWLQSICGFEPEKVEKAAVLFEGEGNRFSSAEKDIQKLKQNGLGADIVKRISDPKIFALAKEIECYCKENNIRIITWKSQEYPEFLRHINTPPRILFAKGQIISLDDKLAVSVVGCRKPTVQGKSIARQIGRNLAENGIVTVSGMAEGIDAEAHRGALDAGGKTIAVLAGSVDTIYPKSNEKLYYEIIKNGTIISERPPGTVVKRYFYQQRNRIVVGLSHGTVVVEGKEKSGTSITARLAVDNNRDVFAVPGNPLVWQAGLPNRIIGEGGIVVDKIERVSEYYKDISPEFFDMYQNEKTEGKNKTEKFSGDDEKILKVIIESGGVSDGEELMEKCGIAPSVLNSKLTILCIKGVLRQESGNRYVLVEY